MRRKTSFFKMTGHSMRRTTSITKNEIVVQITDPLVLTKVGVSLC